MSDLKRMFRKWNRVFGNLRAEMEEVYAALDSIDRKRLKEEDPELGTAVEYVHCTIDHILSDIDWQADDIEDLHKHRAVLNQFKRIDRLIKLTDG